MATYAIGDIQGCFSKLQELLELIKFNPENDQLWFVGDLVNRGPESLQVLRFVRQLKNAIVVLGNHDLHLLALANNINALNINHTLDDILHAPDKDDLINWLRSQKFLHHDLALGFVMVHAGLPPQWDLRLAKECAAELEQVFHADNYVDFLQHMYGDKPDTWADDLIGYDRLRFIVNCFTRIRVCSLNGKLNLKFKGMLKDCPKDYCPWYKIPARKSKGHRILFGHWAALEGKVDESGVFALDTGCVWGGSLTAMRLQDRKLFSVGCSN